jgi:hypothetical protein
VKKRKRKPSLLAYRAEEALRRAMAEAIAEHRRNGKVVRIPADQIEVREPQIEYTVSLKKLNKELLRIQNLVD